jgi:hypothetical protein
MKKSDFSNLVAEVAALGVRHLRDGVLDNDPPYDAAMNRILDASNARLDGITDCQGIEYYPQSVTTPSDIVSFDNAIKNRLEYVEGPNEVDGRRDKNWSSDTRSCLPGLRRAIPSLPFIAPSLANPSLDAGSLGNISASVNLGNEHRYFSGHNPGTTGWGGSSTCGVYGAVRWGICEAQINSGARPVVITETGYNSLTEVNEATQAKYISRLLFVNLKAGNPRSYIYDLKDYTGGDSFGGDGLLRVDDSPKPSYSALMHAIAFFSDPSGSATLAPISLSVSAPSVDSLLFRKTDGTYILALWEEVPSWNTAAHTSIDVSPKAVSVTLGAAPTSVSLFEIDDQGALVSESASVGSNHIALSIDDHVRFLQFRF